MSSRNPINVLYYPEFTADHCTLVKSILLFDELHFMDRPSMMFFNAEGQTQFGTIASASPLRPYEASFREAGVPLFIHSGSMGPISGQWREQINSDLNDIHFLQRFQSGLTTSTTFRKLQIAHGDYGEFGNQDDVTARLIDVNVASYAATHNSPLALFEDKDIRFMDLASPLGCTKQLLSQAAICSAKLNFALEIGIKQGFLPLADAAPYGQLLGAKYLRAKDTLPQEKETLHLTDLSFAIFDELFPNEKLKTLSIKDAVRYRQQSTGAREAFLEHLNLIQSKQTALGTEGDYVGAIEKLVDAEIKPAARAFKNKLCSIDESFWGSISKGMAGFVGGQSLVTVFSGLSLPTAVGLATAASAFAVRSCIDRLVATRAAKRECSISYILALDE